MIRTNIDWRAKVLLLGLLILTFSLRLWRIDGYLLFLGDEGRDVLVAKRILEGKLTLLGPAASVGGFYLGPIYYYLIAPFLWLFGYNPVGPAIVVVLFSSLTTGLIFLFANQELGWRVGLVAGLIYALSPLTIKYGRSSWNPNILPFFSLLLVVFMVRSLRSRQIWPAVLAGIAWGIALQLHYLALILGPIAAFLAMLVPPARLIVKRWLGFGFGSLLGLSPFMLFELRHGFPNSQTIWRFFFNQDQDPVGFQKPLELVERAESLAQQLARWFFGFDSEFSVKGAYYLASGFLLLLIITLLIRRRTERLGILSIGVWWFFGLLGLALYQGQVHDYYFAFLFPAFALVVGIFFGRLLSWFPITLIGLISLTYLGGQLIGASPLAEEPNYQLEQTREIASTVLNRSHGEEYNFALVTGGNSDHAYRYFFEVWGREPVPLEEEVTSQLLVVCEAAECPVLGHSLWEIAGFGRAEIAGVWLAKGGVKVLRLVHYPDSIHLIGQPAPKG